MVRKPVIAGGELVILAHISPEKLADALRPLLSAGVISTNTSSIDSSEILQSYFNLNPSARTFAEFATR
jgi:hypothetical protein